MGLFSSVGKVWKDFTGQTAVEQQNEFNMQMWKMQQEYNTPANQMKRYREAGLNPNLVYGGSGQMAGNATSAPEMTAHQGSAAKALELATTLIGMKGQVESQQLDKIKTLAEITHSQDVLDFEKKRFAIDSIFRDKEFGWKTSNADRDYALKKLGYQLSKDKFDWEKGYTESNHVKPGSTMDFLQNLIANVMGKSPTDVGTDTHNLLNGYFSLLFSPITAIGKGQYYSSQFLDKMIKSVIKNAVGSGTRKD